MSLNNGLKKEELIEVITHLAFYSGWPNAMTAIMVAKEGEEPQLHYLTAGICASQGTLVWQRPQPVWGTPYSFPTAAGTAPYT